MKKGQSVREGATEVQDGCGTGTGLGGYERGGKGCAFQSACSWSVAFAASQFKPFRPIFSCHLPVNFLAFFWTRGWTLGDWTMVRALPRTKAQTHKLGCSVEKCFAPGTGAIKKNICTRSISARACSWKDPLVKLVDYYSFTITCKCLFQGMCVEVCWSFRPIQEYGTFITILFNVRIVALWGWCSDKKICSRYTVVPYSILFFLNSCRYFLQCKYDLDVV